MKRYLLLAAVLFFALWTKPVMADTLEPIGFISYDQYYNLSTNTVVGAFDIYNFTGDPSLGGSALPPDFNVLTFLNINDATLTLDGPDAPSSPISIGTIAPGYLSDAFGNPLASLQFDLGSVFTSATLTGTLSDTTLTVQNPDGSTSTVQVQGNISVTITPSSGSSLVAGTDFAVIDAIVAPEPSTIALILIGLLAIVALKSGLVGGR
jgi:hypothetical protein